jgi:hypothetical protein
VAELSPLRWHYGPTDADPNPGAMWCYDCGSEVWVFEEGYICRGCGRTDDGAQPGAQAQGGQAEHEVIAPDVIVRGLPADVPLTLDFGERVGTAHVERDERGLHVTARVDEQAAALLDATALDDLLANTTAMSFTLWDPSGEDPQRAVMGMGLRRDPDAPAGRRTGPVTLRMRLGRDGKWHAEP